MKQSKFGGFDERRRLDRRSRRRRERLGRFKDVERHRSLLLRRRLLGRRLDDANTRRAERIDRVKDDGRQHEPECDRRGEIDERRRHFPSAKSAAEAAPMTVDAGLAVHADVARHRPQQEYHRDPQRYRNEHDQRRVERADLIVDRAQHRVEPLRGRVGAGGPIAARDRRAAGSLRGAAALRSGRG